MQNEPNVPQAEPFAFIDDGTSIKISAMSGHGWGKECSNMIEKTYRYRHKYTSVALMVAEPTRSWVRPFGERINNNILISSKPCSQKFLITLIKFKEMFRIIVSFSKEKCFFAISATLLLLLRVQVKWNVQQSLTARRQICYLTLRVPRCVTIPICCFIEGFKWCNCASVLPETDSKLILQRRRARGLSKCREQLQWFHSINPSSPTWSVSFLSSGLILVTDHLHLVV